MALSREQGIEFERLLKERRAKLAAELEEDVVRTRQEDYGALAGPVTDTGDQASADLLSDLDNAEVSRDLRMLRELNAALERLAEGSYGSCIDCGAEIGLERLRAYPAALRCVDCQRVHEKTYAHPGESRL
ncbi:MAG TPA: TraR/DksA family transcriptional regulator [Burkholderiales bacterium]|nr:TraR/DksA family transcriptional regulator [Burkholderiales bacterium]